MLGGVAAIALLIYAVLLFALVKLIPITLTLPGIAGLILTLGVAADANIVIFERIKEEARAGRSIPAAISDGYAKALRTIIDANVVTIGVAFILFMLATAGVKGFAFTLGIGTIVSLFTAVLATSAILGSMARTRLLGLALRARRRQSERRVSRFDFIGKSKFFFSISGVILVIGALAIAGLGTQLRHRLRVGHADHDAARAQRVAWTRCATRSRRSGYGDAKVQTVDDPELGRQRRSRSPPPTLRARRGAPRCGTRSTTSFGVDRRPTSRPARSGRPSAPRSRSTAVIAIIASLILISIYIGLRFEFKYAVPVLIALAHDLLITAGVYALSGREVTTSTVAALLTILGYSLYDTIIVFDRIRENVPRMPRATFSQIVNRSMSEVIVRSLVTSLSTLLPVTALMLFGGETLRDFAFALLVGVASGAYSSIFIAAPVLAQWKEREPVYVRRRRGDHGRARRHGAGVRDRHDRRRRPGVRRPSQAHRQGAARRRSRRRPRPPERGRPPAPGPPRRPTPSRLRDRASEDRRRGGQGPPRTQPSPQEAWTEAASR